MQNKNMTSKPVRPLYSLPIPDNHFDSIDMNFIGPLPKDEEYNMLMTVTS